MDNDGRFHQTCLANPTGSLKHAMADLGPGFRVQKSLIALRRPFPLDHVQLWLFGLHFTGTKSQNQNPLKLLPPRLSRAGRSKKPS